MRLQRYGDHHSDRQLLVVRVLHIAESGLTSIRDIKLIPQCMSLLLAQSGKMRLIELHSFLRTPSREKTQQNSAANAAVGQQRTKSSAPVPPCSRTRTTVTLDLPSEERWGYNLPT